MPMPYILDPVQAQARHRHTHLPLLCGAAVPWAGLVPGPHPAVPAVPAVPVPAVPPCLGVLSRVTPRHAQGTPRSITGIIRHPMNSMWYLRGIYFLAIAMFRVFRVGPPRRNFSCTLVVRGLEWELKGR